MAAVLVVREDEGRGEYPCGSILTVGRVPPNDVLLPSDSKVSRSHAMIRLLGDGKHYLLDLGSANGTYVNGNRISVPREIKDGDEIRVGEHLLTFRREEEPKDESAGSLGAGASTVLTVGGVNQAVTILVADVRGYTSLSESVSPEELAAIMGRLFQGVTRLVERHEGVVDKFIGDAVMARWLSGGKGIPESVQAALRTAAGLNQEVAAVNAAFPSLPSPLRMGVGVNSGQAVIGTVGAGGRREHTVLGDCVNVAFRLESASKELAADIVVGSDSCRHLPLALWRHGIKDIQVKGKSRRLNVWPLSFEDAERLFAATQNSPPPN